MPEGQVLAPGAAEGATLVLDEPLSFWGGLDARSGRVVDRRHPQLGREVAGRILVMPSGRGSSSSSSVLAEALLLGTGPVGIILQRADPIVVLGVVVADELYGAGIPVVVLEAADYVAVAKMKRVAMDATGVIRSLRK
jgi:uncharacterized protein